MNCRNSFLPAFLLVLTVVCSGSPCLAQHYPIVDTGQVRCYDNRLEIKYPKASEPFFGQDARYQGNRPAYRDNGDGTITDLVTGLMWQKDPGPKKTFEEAVAGASACRVGEYDDWRLPSIKELYSLILFSGEDINPHATDTSDLNPFIDTKYFGFVYGDPAKGERVIDSQMATSTKYVGTTMRGNETMFGVNFADGRIKGYPAGSGRPGRGPKGYYVFYVRGNAEYGENDFHDNGDGTITDRATGLTWAKVDSGHLRAGKNKDGKLNWEQALRWAEDLQYAGHSDWRLPNAKELQSIVDYTRSPDTTRSAAIDPVLSVTPIRDALGEVNYPFYWSSTTHKRMGSGEAAVYVAFGRSQGWMPGFRREYSLLDVHGAGSQRSDPKAGDPAQFPRGRGPQGDVIEIYNMVRPVRGGKAAIRETGPALKPQPSTRRGRGPDQGAPMGPGQRGPGRMGPGGMGPGRMRPGRMGPGGMGPGRQGPGGMGPGRPMGGNRPGFVRRLDRDGDGKVSREEFDGPADAFDHLDADRDGYLNDGERPGHQGMGPQQGPPPGNRRGAAARQRPARQPKPPARPEVEASSDAADADKDILADAAWNELAPSIVFILADDMGWTGLSRPVDDRVPASKSDFYQTPRIDELARQGIFGITNRTIAFMEQQCAAGRPFYVQLSHYAVHRPSKALDGTRTACAERPSGTRHRNVEYVAMTRDLDTGVGMVLDSIDRLGIAENTYVVFMSDNGAAAPPRIAENLPLSGGKATFWEGGVRVPLNIRRSRFESRLGHRGKSIRNQTWSGTGVRRSSTTASSQTPLYLWNRSSRSSTRPFFCRQCSLDTSLMCALTRSRRPPILEAVARVYGSNHRKPPTVTEISRCKPFP